MADLPRPDVKVEQTKEQFTESVKVTISRPGSDGEARGRVHVGVGTTTADAVKSVVEKIIGDTHSIEWLPEPKKGG